MISPYNTVLPAFERKIKAAELAARFELPESTFEDMELAYEPSGVVEVGFWPFKTEKTENGITTRWAKGKVFKFRRRTKG